MAGKTSILELVWPLEFDFLIYLLYLNKFKIKQFNIYISLNKNNKMVEN